MPQTKATYQADLTTPATNDPQLTLDKLEFEPIKGYPMLHWRGKRPFTSTHFYPAQLKEQHGQAVGGWLNKIFWGDNFQVMSHLLKHYRGKVKLIYIDPPFDSKADYAQQINLRGRSVNSDKSSFEEKQYTDLWAYDGFLQFMYERLIICKELLSDNGTIFVHLDPTKCHYVRVLMDEIFGPENFRNEIIWRCTNSHNSATLQLGPIHQNILFYSKSANLELHPGYRPFSKAYIESRFKYEDERGIYQPNFLTGPGVRSGESGAEWRGFNPTTKGRHWAIPKAVKILLPNKGEGLSTLELLDALYTANLLVLPQKQGGQPMYKQYLTKGVPYQDIWAYQANTSGVLYQSSECIDQDVKWLEQEQEITGYPTQKPEGLVARIVESCTSPGDIVLDCFMGSGTTQAVAMKWGRRYLGADINLGAVQTTTKRLIGVAGQVTQQGTVVIQPPLALRKTSPGENNGNGEDAETVEPTKEVSIFYTGFEVYNVNNYDIFRNPVEAKELLVDALELQKLPAGHLFDGEKDGRLWKVMPVNKIATKQDLNELITGLNYADLAARLVENPTQPAEKITLVCMGHDTDLAATLNQEVANGLGVKAGAKTPLDVQALDILRDRNDLQFKRDSEAKVSIKDGYLTIEAFYPMNLLSKLSLEKEKVTDWREMVDSVMIDWNYDGAIFTPTLVDLPEKNGLVQGRYPVPDDAGTVRVKITDVLSESLEVEKKAG